VPQGVRVRVSPPVQQGKADFLKVGFFILGQHRPQINFIVINLFLKRGKPYGIRDAITLDVITCALT